jgi:hypothetical protein
MYLGVELLGHMTILLFLTSRNYQTVPEWGRRLTPADSAQGSHGSIPSPALAIFRFFGNSQPSQPSGYEVVQKLFKTSFAFSSSLTLSSERQE